MKTSKLWFLIMTALIMTGVACSGDGKEEVVTPPIPEEPSDTAKPDVPVIESKLVTPKGHVDIMIPAELIKVNDAANQFSLNFFDQMVKHTEASSNIVVSPFYAQAALAMMANGAKGETLDEMLAVLNMKGFSLDEINSYNQTVIKAIADLDNTTYPMSANGVWSKQDLLDGFSGSMQAAYDAKVEKTDFSQDAIAAINDWAYKKTYGMIPRLFEEKEEVNSEVVLANALYFYGVWADPFGSAAKKDAFTNADKSAALQSYMEKEEERLHYLSCETFDLCDKYYGNGAFSMTFLLPHKDVTPGKAVSDLAQMDWKGLTAKLLGTRVLVTLTVPSFELKGMSYDLTPALKEMGMQKAFSDTAEFGNMTDKAALPIGKVNQKTAMMLTKQGTQTATTMKQLGIISWNGEETADFYLSRPFAFLIWERSTGVILFAGVVNKL